MIKEKEKLLLEITNMLVSTLDPSLIVSFISEEIKKIGLADYVGIGLIENEFLVPIIAENGRILPLSETFHRYRISLKNGVTGYAASKNEIVYVPDVSKEPRYIQAHPDVKSELAIPLREGDKVIGILNFESKKLSPYSKEDIEFLSNLANEVAIAIRNAKLFKELETEKRRLTSLVNALPDPVLLLDRENKIELFNPQAAEVFHLKEEDKGKNFSQISEKFIPPEKISDFLVCEREICKKEIKINEKFFEFVTVPIRIGKKTVYTCLILHDITNQKTLDRMKAEFSSMLIHDLRTPLTTIIGTFDLLSESLSGTIEDKLCDLLAIAAKEAKRMLDMTNELLEMSRLETGKIELRKERIRIKELLDLSIHSLSLAAKKKGIKINCIAESGDSWVFVDKERIIRVMINLLDNAIKYSPKDSEINVLQDSFFKDKEKWVKVVVQDRGPGIPPEDIESIFETYKRKKKGKGLGIGLAISKLIVEAHTGEIGVESKLHEGTSFWFTIPTETKNY